jgi:hypothetical protein
VRRLLSAAAVTAIVPVLLAVPVVSRPEPSPHPVAPHLTTLHVAPTAARHGLLADTGERSTARFGLVGATWTPGLLGDGATVEVRVHQAGGWSDWAPLEATDAGATAGSADARHAALVHPGQVVAEPMWVGPSDGVETRVVAASSAPAAVPDGLQVLLVDGGTSAADAHPGQAAPLGSDVASAAQAQPTIYTRADWGADESLRLHACPSGPDYGSTVLMGFVHHTDNANGYSRSEVPSIIRSIYAYHVQANGWCDIGYNFLVDRFGQIWEGRYGGITKPVIGAHTGGFNSNTFGVSLIGNYTSTAPSSAMLGALEHLFAWKLGAYYRDPLGKTTLIAGYFSGSRFAAGQSVTFNNVSGHRDADQTTCPGSAAYADLPAIRSGVRAAMGAGFVAPAVSPTSARMAAGRISVGSRVIGPQTWTMTVRDAGGATVVSTSGTANRSTPVAATWNLTDAAGAPVSPGTYTITLTGANSDGVSARPFRRSVVVTPPVTVSAPAHVPLDTDVAVHGAGRPNGEVGLKVVSNGVVTDLGTVSVNSAGAWTTGSLTVTAHHDLAWRVSDPTTGYVAKRKTRVAPWISSDVPATTFVRAGSAYSPFGTASPDAGNTVTVTLQRPTSSMVTSGPTVSVSPDGTWSSSFVPTAPTSAWVVDSRGLQSQARFVYPVSAPTATAPTSGYANRTVRVHGNAGHAPVKVSLFSRLGTSSSWTLVRQVTAATDGGFSLHLPLPDAAGRSLSWKLANGYGAAATGAVSVLATFPPTATGPTRAAWNSTRELSGTAVPGDVVTVWTRPTGTTSWVQAGSTKADGSKAWTFPLTITHDIDWRVTSKSGRSAVATIVVRPTIHAPASSPAGAAITIFGRAIPGQPLTLYRRWVGATTWKAVRTVTVAADGSWSVRRRPTLSAVWRATSHGQTSRSVTVSVS